MDQWLEQFARAMFQRSADTAHDLKTPLNVAVLNLELLRMRVRKLADGGAEDEKTVNYAKSIESELRRMGRIFDAFFLLSTPPKSEGAPEPVDAAALAAEAGAAQGFELSPNGQALVLAHETRIRQALRMFFEGAAKAIDPAGRRATISSSPGLRIVVEGKPVLEEGELSKVFKFYYTDPSGNPDLSLAAARLVIETYGGEVNASEESDKVALFLSLPLSPGE